MFKVLYYCNSIWISLFPFALQYDHESQHVSITDSLMWLGSISVNTVNAVNNLLLCDNDFEFMAARIYIWLNNKHN